MHRHDETGMTLLEILLVLVLIGVVAAAAQLSLRNFIDRTPGFDDRLRECRQRAIRAARVVDLSSDSIRVSCLPDGQLLGVGRWQLAGERP